VMRGCGGACAPALSKGGGGFFVCPVEYPWSPSRGAMGTVLPPSTATSRLAGSSPASLLPEHSDGDQHAYPGQAAAWG
jgi:hypothetical protein